MTPTRTSHRIAFVLIAWLIIQPTGAANEDALARAKSLYLSAAYDEALALLDSLQNESSSGVATEAAQYRVFCLLALERSGEARRAIEEIVNADPFYGPSDNQTSPRIRTVFQEVRRALLPEVVQRSYAEAKAAFDRKDPQAVEQFDRVLALLDDPDFRGAGSLSDLRTVVSGFRDLSQAVASMPPVGNVSATAAGRAGSPIDGTLQPAALDAPAVRSGASSTASHGAATVTPPVALFQPLPPWSPPKNVEWPREFEGTLEVVIDESGNVTSATLSKSIHRLYDAELLKVARTWKFKPAEQNGVPIRFAKILEIHLRPPR